jgi:glycosyltransferase involved in cell wall biosynthesis
MKILMLSPHVPYPPNSGGRIRQWEEIKYLGQRHDLTVVYFACTREEYSMRSLIGNYCNNVIAVKLHNIDSSTELSDFQKLPWPVRMFGSIQMQKTLNNLRSDNFEAVIIEFIFMAMYRDLFPVCTILHEHNIESSIYKQYSEMPTVAQEQIYGVRKSRAFWKATWMLMADYENRIWPTFPLRVTVSEKDKQEMDSRCPSGRTIVAENGVNVRNMPLIKKNVSGKILFMGKMDYYPNIDAASFLVKSVMPYVWQKDPGVSLCIAGMNPPPSVTALASDTRIEVIANPDNMREVAGQCSLTVVPLRLGGGTRIKILDSMAMGLPVVATSLGSEGLFVTDGINILIRDDPGQFADAVLQVLSDDDLADALRLSGRRLVEERYDWELIFGHLEQELLHLVEKNRALGVNNNGST